VSSLFLALSNHIQQGTDSMRHLGFQVGNTKVMTRSGLVSREYVLICILDVKENIRHPSHKCWMGKKNKNIKFSHGARAATLKKSCQGIRQN